ncbi:hypothetical protein ABE288_20995 [Bacillus salipaludis]|uniref:hypothetical protein n=1 Tax=Bacillus salipaludis TaxID=2547811 RepID=UPI003D1E3CE9
MEKYIPQNLVIMDKLSHDILNIVNNSAMKEFQKTIDQMKTLIPKIPLELFDDVKRLGRHQESLIDLQKPKVLMEQISSSINLSASLQEALNNIKLPEPQISQVLSTLDVTHIRPYWEHENVQEEIQQELQSLEQITDQMTFWERVNNWANTAMDTKDTIRKKAPALYLLTFVFLYLGGILIRPAVEDIVKEKLWHISDYLEVKPKETPKNHAKLLKESLIEEYPEIEGKLASVRVTNRESPVFRSKNRKSGQIDTIPSNHPVLILQKKKNWTLIVYRDNVHKEVTGWVFTGNLRK